MRKIKYLARNGRVIEIPEDQAGAFENTPLIKKRIDKNPPKGMRHKEIRAHGGPKEGRIEYSDKKELAG